MIHLAPLKAGQLQQVYEWDNAVVVEDFAHYAARLLLGNWQHYAINRGDDFVGCLSLELIGANEVTFHLSMRTHSVPLRELRRVLVNTGAVLFQAGIKRVIAEICSENRAARLIAALCGMSPVGQEGTLRRFELTAAEFESNPQRWN